MDFRLFRQVIPLENPKEGDFFRMAEKEFQLDYPLSPESVVHKPAIVSTFRPKVLSKKVASKPLLTIKANVPKTIPEPPLSESAKPSGLYESDVGETKEGRWEVNMSVNITIIFLRCWSYIGESLRRRRMLHGKKTGSWKSKELHFACFQNTWNC